MRKEVSSDRGLEKKMLPGRAMPLRTLLNVDGAVAQNDGGKRRRIDVGTRASVGTVQIAIATEEVEAKVHKG
jgi:hypothetical protein